MLYSPESNDVHVLNPAARELLVLLTDRAWTVVELTSHLAGSASETARAEIHDGIAETLAGLDRAGLIAPQVA